MRFRAASSLLFAGVVSFGACSEPSLEIGYDDPVARGGSAGTNGSGGLGGRAPCVKTTCQGKGPYACGDCIDNDNDHLIDAEDPDCLGPCDNTEDKYYGGIPGQNGDSCRKDCYFDQNSGNGDDRCDWSFSCDERMPSSACPYDPSTNLPGGTCDSLFQKQDMRCTDVACLPITPNGCDCFGCCELPARSGNFVYIGTELNGSGSCDAAHVTDPAACAPCTPVQSCANKCDACEICAGQSSLDTGCAATKCSFGTPCGPNNSCSDGTYCVTGCCIEVPL